MKNILKRSRLMTGGAALSLVAGAASIMALSPVVQAGATSQAADKMAVQGDNGIVLCSPNASAANSVNGACTNYNTSAYPLLQGSIKLSSPKNLVVEITMDCSTVTDTTVQTTSSNGNKSTSSAEAVAGVHAWLTITPAGQTPSPTDPVIAVTPNGATNSSQINPGDVTFCNRDQYLSQSLTNNNAGAVTLATTLNIQTSYANAFNFVSPADNNTSMVQTITLWGETNDAAYTFGNPTCTSTTTTNCSSAGAVAWVGQRTMVLTPANTAQNALF